MCNCQKTRCGRDLLSLGVVGTNLFFALRFSPDWPRGPLSFGVI
jgi:hypothetical protein